eukprot:PITA_10582
MPLSVKLCLAVAFAPLLLLCSSKTCLGTQYQDCLSNTSTCGDVEFGYPFGQSGSGCGDPDFQLRSCDYESHTLINIGGDEYHILESSFLENSSTYKILTIVNDNLWGGKCNFSGNYSQFWRPDSHFQVLDTYANLTLWKQCDQVHENISGSQVHNLSLCGSDWYYSLNPHLNLEGTTFCNVFQLPVRQNSSQQPINNKTLLAQGFEVTWRVDPRRDQSCEACLHSNGYCGYNVSKPTTFLCYCRDGTAYPDKCPSNGTQDTGGRNMSGIIIGCSVAGVALAAALILFLTVYAKRGKPPGPDDSSSKVEKFLKEHACETPTRYSLLNLKKITNNFAVKLGEGGYGVVYKGRLPNGALVAVKILDRHRHSETHFMNEVTTIGRVHHVNLVRLLGYCFENPTSALVYEYMANGSLDKYIFAGKDKGQVLMWEQLYSIALGAARGIAYLHHDCDKRIIHFDIKPHNILLDADFTPKVSDFGLAKPCGKGDDHVSMTAGRGTPGYVAPEVCDDDLGPVTDKSDVYSFGILLLEIVGGRKNIDLKVSRSSQIYFPEWVFKLLESGELGKRLRGGEFEAEDEEMAKRLTKVGMWCIQYNSSDRPDMSRVVQMIEGNGDDVTDPPMPFDPWVAGRKPLRSKTEEPSSIEIRP